MVFGISFEGNFGIAVGAFEVEPEDFDAQVSLFIAYLHTHVKLGSDVEIICAGIASEGHGQHVSDHHQLVLAPASLDYTLMIEVLREIFDENLSFCHLK
jgi:hypothetical protein